MRIASTILVLLASLASFAPPASAQQVWVVDRDGGVGVDFTSLPNAVGFVADGDILLVRESPFSYGPLTVSAKSLTILAEPAVPGARPKLTYALVRDLAANQTVVLRGFAVEPPVLVLQPAVWVRECAGAVFMEDLDVRPTQSNGVIAPITAVQNSPRVILNRCSIESPPLEPAGTQPVAGLTVSLSSVALYDCVLSGADGSPAWVDPFTFQLTPSLAGGVGAVLVSGDLLVAGSTLRGGRGGDGTIANGACQPSSDGGAGVRVEAGTLTRLDSVFVPGLAGADLAACPQVGVDGVALEVVGGTVTTITDTLRRFEVGVPVHEGTSAQNVIEGVPGELVVLLVAFTPDAAIFPGLGGALAGAPPYLAVVLGSIPASGTLAFAVPVATGSLPASIEGIDVYEQVLVAGAQGFGLLGTPTVVTVVR